MNQRDEFMLELMQMHGGGDKVFCSLQLALFKCMTEEQRNQWFEEVKNLGLA